jgi:hypothetical protein
VGDRDRPTILNENDARVLPERVECRICRGWEHCGVQTSSTATQRPKENIQRRSAFEPLLAPTRICFCGARVVATEIRYLPSAYGTKGCLSCNSNFHQTLFVRKHDVTNRGSGESSGVNTGTKLAENVFVRKCEPDAIDISCDLLVREGDCQAAPGGKKGY